MKKVAENALGSTRVNRMEPKMASEDFSYYLKEIPGTYFNTGARLADESKVFPHHHPRFDFDENAMLDAAKVIASLIAYYREE